MAYTVELWRNGAPWGIERTIASTDGLAEACRAYEAAVVAHPGRIVVLRNGAIHLARDAAKPT